MEQDQDNEVHDQAREKVDDVKVIARGDSGERKTQLF